LRSRDNRLPSRRLAAQCRAGPVAGRPAADETLGPERDHRNAGDDGGSPPPKTTAPAATDDDDDDDDDDEQAPQAGTTIGGSPKVE